MWSVKLSDDQREAIAVLIKAQGESYDSDLRDALRALELARWDDLPEAQLPWSSVIEQAELQGISEADVVWDMSGRKKEAAAPRVRKARKPGTRAPKRTRKAAG